MNLFNRAGLTWMFRILASPALGLGYAFFRQNINPDATRVKELEIVCDTLVDPETVFLRAMSFNMSQNDSRQRISRLLHR